MSEISPETHENSPQQMAEVIDYSDVAVVTVATRNYFHRVRSLFASVAEHMPGALQVACSVDAFDGLLDPEEEGYEIFEASDLGIPRFEQFAFALNPTAACCALKPHAVLRALKYPGIKRVLYIDNDMGLYSRPDELFDFLDRHSFVLTPHHSNPLPAGASPDEMTLLPYGIYNAGMFALNNNEEAVRFLEWWADWMSDPRHVFADWAYDQIWLNYAPVYCRDAGIFHGSGYNVAFWNFAERDLRQVGDAFLCGEQPLVLFHFSNFVDENPTSMVSGNLDVDVVESDATRALGVTIAESWRNHGRDECLALGYQFRSWHDGASVSEKERDYIRDNWDAIDPELDLWSAALADDHPELYGDIRADYLTALANAKKKQGGMLNSLMDISLRKVLSRVRKRAQ